MKPYGCVDLMIEGQNSMSNLVFCRGTLGSLYTICHRWAISPCAHALGATKSHLTVKEVGSLLLDYIEYHDFVMKKSAQLGILRFEDAVSSPEYIIRVVCQRLDFDLNNSAVEEKALVGQQLVVMKESDKSVEGSSLPNEERKQMKIGVESHVRNHLLCARALELYAQLLDHSFELNEN